MAKTRSVTLAISLALLSGRPAELAPIEVSPRFGEPASFLQALSAAALERTVHAVRYDGAYRRIPFPGGDVPDDVGVCTDVVIRAYRAIGVDLQQEVHDEMKEDFGAFPQIWGLAAPDTNIDHRRVPNLRVFFEREGEVLPISGQAADYHPGDIVTWRVWGRPHIGIVVNRRSRDGRRFLVVHNIGRGPRVEDVLFDYEISGHYQYYGPKEAA